MWTPEERALIEWAQQQLIAKRLSLGLNADGTRPGGTPASSPGPQRLGEVLTRTLTTLFPGEPEDLPSWDSLVWVCDRHGPVEPVELRLVGPDGQERVFRRIRGRCRACMLEEEEARKAEAEARERQRRLDLYAAVFPPAAMGRLVSATLEAFERRPGAERALEEAQAWATRLPAPEPPGLWLWGTPGNGKSHLGAALANTARTRGQAVAWVHAPSWLADLGAMEAPDRERRLALAATADVLVLDDLGGGRLTAPRVAWLQDLIDARYRAWRPLVITSNLSPGQLRQVLNSAAADGGAPEGAPGDGDRIVDRLSEMCIIVRNTASSYRLERAQRREGCG